MLECMFSLLAISPVVRLYHSPDVFEPGSNRPRLVAELIVTELPRVSALGLAERNCAGLISEIIIAAGQE